MSKEFTFHYHPKHDHPFCFVPVTPRTVDHFLHVTCDCCQEMNIGGDENIEGMFICTECNFDLCMNCFYRPLQDGGEQTEEKLEFSVHLDGKTYEEVREVQSSSNNDQEDDRNGRALSNNDQENDRNGGAPSNEDVLDEDRRD